MVLDEYIRRKEKNMKLEMDEEKIANNRCCVYEHFVKHPLLFALETGFCT
ncbi:MAG TPA: hypothetical protein PKC21_06660 [Oligoflexia bacterium]|nr:hypothetical protein [Oligoflexia bacterium]